MALDAAPFVNSAGGPTAVPAGSKVGDAALIVTSASVSVSLGAGADQFPTIITPPVADPGCMFYLGQLTTLDPIEINLSTGGGTRSQHAQIITVPGAFQMDRLVTGSAPYATPGEAATVEPLPGTGQGALVVATFYGGIGGSTWPGASGGATWTGNADVGRGNSTYHGVGSTWTGDPAVTGPVTVGPVAVNDSWISVLMIGVGLRDTVAPPCRLFPREDGLGVGGGRIYPPPRSQQRSGRRFGYY